MAGEKEILQAKAAYDTLCEMLNEKDWKYDSDEDKFTIRSGARGDDLPIDIKIVVDPERLIVSLLSQLPYNVPKEKRVELALAISTINYVVVDGSFDYSPVTGSIVFRMTSSFRESLVSKEMFEYMLYVSCTTIDEYNDKFLMLGKGMLSIEQFIASIDN